MTRQGGSYMMLHLVCKTTAEPHVKDRGCDIAREANLEADEVGRGLIIAHP